MLLYQASESSYFIFCIYQCVSLVIFNIYQCDNLFVFILVIESMCRNYGFCYLE